MRSTRLVLLSLLSGALLAATPSVASAGDTGASPTSHDGAVSASQQSDVTEFWTAERMRQAEPLDVITVDAVPGTSTAVPEGSPRTIAPMSPTNGGSAWTGGGAAVKTSGRVFFTYGGRTASCSGNAVTSANKSTVMTAGHCVKLDGAWHTDWVFVPGYNNGNRPYGTWTARQTLSTPQWTASEDINFDIGAAVVNQLNGQYLTDVVGSQGIAFNQPRGEQVYDFGFPAASPYNGETLIYCSGRTINDFLLSNGIGLACNMTGGSSGGPWFRTFNEATGVGVQTSVNSFKYNFLPTYMFGPYFGTDAQNLYGSAQSA
ncbi:peptidase [Phytomonospora sp. NPDC050363]|uniref:trypsin-like serine peptidase n=1 Tax=Phytomonospora sp. NPDC050363 TaxID=3155642 RepID=UPI0033F49F7C